MKHVFIVNSHTTFLSSIGTKNYLGIKDEDVILLFARGYSNSIYPLPYTIIRIDDIYAESKSTFFSSKGLRKYVGKVENDIIKYINDRFHLYVANFGSPVVCILYTSKYCKRISYIQEGAQFYLSAFKHNKWKDLIKDVITNVIYRRPVRAWIRPCYYKKYYLYKQRRLYVYGLDENITTKAFEYHRIKWPVPQIDFKYNPDASFFILDGLVKNNMCESSVLLKNTERLVKENASSFNYLKFHPNQDDEEVKQIISFFETNNFKYEVMDQSVPFELIMLSFEKLKIVGMASSLCFFAKQLGHNVVCHDDWLFEESELFRRHIKNTGTKLYKEIYE